MQIMVAGHAAVLELPFNPEVEPEHSGFFLSGNGNADTVLRLCPVSSLPPLPVGVHEYGSRWYHESVPFLTWHGHHGLPQLVVDRSEAPKVITIQILEEAVEEYRQTRDILRLLEIEKFLPECGGVMLHGSLVSTSRGGIVFSGPSGIGKSTQAALWEKYQGAETLNGDRAGIMPDDGDWQAWSLPFAGTSNIMTNGSVPLKTIVMLEQSSENAIFRLRPVEAFSLLYPQANLQRWNKPHLSRAADILLSIVAEVPVYRLACRPDESAVYLLNNTLWGENK